MRGLDLSDVRYVVLILIVPVAAFIITLWVLS